ncbi:MAG: Abi family protein [Muribaculaceae bacterium]|nr:Abi family protein [Muribaculaceae bacterium]
MPKTSTTIDRQIIILESRGLLISDKDKAKEILEDVGYYRLGFYLFPFEKSYPHLENRSHEYIPGASFKDVVNLYYFDCDLRLILMRYLNRIEIAFRTAIIYNLSNKYCTNPIWFVSSDIVNRSYTADFERKVYNTDFRRNPIIHRHHKKHPDERFAPAWKTIEFMTFGAVLKLYEQLKEREDKILISNKFAIRQIVTFENYMHTIRHVRNVCAHGLLLYDLRLPQAIRRGPAAYNPSTRSNIIGALSVIKYMMRQVSVNRANDLCRQINKLYENLCTVSPKLKTLIPDFSTI